MVSPLAALLAIIGGAHALRMPGPMHRPQPQLVQRQPHKTALSSALAASLALVIGASTPIITSADVPQPALVQQYGGSLVADDEDLRPAQQKFLEERARMKQKYDTQVESTYKDAEETKDKKNVYITIVGGLIAVAFIAPMVSFFYYTGGK